MSYHGLIGGEQDACRYIHITVTQGTDRHIRQQLGIIPFCLIDQLYTVGQEQHILHPVVPHQHVYERDADTRLSRTGSHYHKYTLLSSCDGFYCPVNCYTLIISWFMAMGIIVERSFYYVEFIRCIVLRCQITVV